MAVCSYETSISTYIELQNQKLRWSGCTENIKMLLRIKECTRQISWSSVFKGGLKFTTTYEQMQTDKLKMSVAHVDHLKSCLLLWSIISVGLYDWSDDSRMLRWTAIIIRAEWLEIYEQSQLAVLEAFAKIDLEYALLCIQLSSATTWVPLSFLFPDLLLGKVDVVKSGGLGPTTSTSSPYERSFASKASVNQMVQTNHQKNVTSWSIIMKIDLHLLIQ